MNFENKILEFLIDILKLEPEILGKNECIQIIIKKLSSLIECESVQIIEILRIRETSITYQKYYPENPKPHKTTTTKGINCFCIRNQRFFLSKRIDKINHSIYGISGSIFDNSDRKQEKIPSIIIPPDKNEECVIFYPLVRNKECIGVIKLCDFKNPNRFSLDSIIILQAVENSISNLLHIYNVIEMQEKRIKEHTKNIYEALEYEKTLLDTVIHELDAPTVAIRGTAERLSKGIINNMLSIPNQILKLSNIDDLCQLIFMLYRNVHIAQSEELRDSQKVDHWNLQRDIVDGVINFMKPLFRNRGLPLDTTEVYLRGSPTYLIVNRELFQQVFFNLFSNAIKCSTTDNENFKVEINSEYDPKKGLKIYFKDWGIGIPQGEQENIFEKRKRGSNALYQSGMGMGLWVIRRILNDFDCCISVISNSNPTTFTISIPNSLTSFSKPSLNKKEII
ncbi:MAG: HAMP domain-containing histidine kinase [Ignavibacteria bacterium]|nr:HAMP domain-containing histidine kinase [Ignavibacteria bacterium]